MPWTETGGTKVFTQPKRELKEIVTDRNNNCKAAATIVYPDGSTRTVEFEGKVTGLNTWSTKFVKGSKNVTVNNR